MWVKVIMPFLNHIKNDGSSLRRYLYTMTDANKVRSSWECCWSNDENSKPNNQKKPRILFNCWDILWSWLQPLHKKHLNFTCISVSSPLPLEELWRTTESLSVKNKQCLWKPTSYQHVLIIDSSSVGNLDICSVLYDSISLRQSMMQFQWRHLQKHSWSFWMFLS